MIMKETQFEGSPRVAIIGAGLGGVACAVNLARSGIDRFTVFEKAEGPGGVWWQNRYPGCEVDVHSNTYSFSFMRYDWSRTHASQAEVLQYVQETIDWFGIRNRFAFDTSVAVARWDEISRTYSLETSRGESGPFDVVVSCVGMLSNARWPEWPGLEEFQGPVIHSSMFTNNDNWLEKRVAVVGTGSTACQLAPAIAERVAQLDVYQREPGYVLPKKARSLTNKERERFRRHRLLQKIDRMKVFHEVNKSLRAFDVDSTQQQRIRDYHSKYLAKIVVDPTVRAALTPNYPFGCKRPVFASTYYPMFNRNNVELIPQAVERVTRTGLVDSEGVERPADVLILATGFQATNYLAGLKVFGAGGLGLHEMWGNEPSAFLGMTVPGFPNFFMLYGPNTNGGGSICAQLERQAEVVTKMVRRLARAPQRIVDTRPFAASVYDTWMQKALRSRRSAFHAGCHNYYYSSSGKNVTQWPHSHLMYLMACRTLPRIGFVMRSRDRSRNSSDAGSPRMPSCMLDGKTE
jgi:cation diffusion facilitator CzcD-associated flavoprotein CzcO